MRTTKKRSARKAQEQGLPKIDGFWAEYQRQLDQWKGAFKQERTWRRVVDVLLGLLTSQGRSTITNSILYRGDEQKDWSADYRVFSRESCEWDPRDLFAPALIEGVKFLCPDAPIVIALDDTGLPKSGLKIPQARFIHDPLALKFLEKQIMWGIRMLHAVLLIPQYTNHRPLAISIAFEPVPPLLKLRPGVELNEEEQAIRTAQEHNSRLTVRASDLIRHLREVLDKNGHSNRQLLVVVDGSFTTGDVVSSLPHDTQLIGRFRKNAKLRAPLMQRRGKSIYGDMLPTPELTLKDESIPTLYAECHYGGGLRKIRFKEMCRLYWPEGTRSKMMRMIIVEPIPYIIVGRKKRGYNRPAFLLTTDLITPASEMIQAYLNRWQIEVLHRDLKSGLGVGQVQAFSEMGNERIHGATVAAYALLNIAALRYFGGERTEAFPELPLWRKRKPPLRVSQHELITILRNSLVRAAHFTRDPLKTKMPNGWSLPRRETYQAA